MSMVISTSKALLLVSAICLSDADADVDADVDAAEPSRGDDDGLDSGTG